MGWEINKENKRLLKKILTTNYTNYTKAFQNKELLYQLPIYSPRNEKYVNAQIDKGNQV